MFDPNLSGALPSLWSEPPPPAALLQYLLGAGRGREGLVTAALCGALLSSLG